MSGWCYVSVYLHALMSSCCHVLFAFDIYKPLHPLLRERERDLMSLLIGSSSSDNEGGTVAYLETFVNFFFFMLCIISFQLFIIVTDPTPLFLNL